MLLASVQISAIMVILCLKKKKKRDRLKFGVKPLPGECLSDVPSLLLILLPFVRLHMSTSTNKVAGMEGFGL